MNFQVANASYIKFLNDDEMMYNQWVFTVMMIFFLSQTTETREPEAGTSKEADSEVSDSDNPSQEQNICQNMLQYTKDSQLLRRVIKLANPLLPNVSIQHNF